MSLKKKSPKSPKGTKTPKSSKTPKSPSVGGKSKTKKGKKSVKSPKSSKSPKSTNTPKSPKTPKSPSVGGKSKTKKGKKSAKSLIKKEKWVEYDDALKISDDEADDSPPFDSSSLFAPSFALKTQGSVVDMLISGPSPVNLVAIAISVGDWEEHDDALKLEEEVAQATPVVHSGLFAPSFALKTQGSVVDMLMDGPATKPMSGSVSPSVAVQNESEWEEHDDCLRISDDEEEEEVEEEVETSASGLFTPKFALKTQGSVVDMLMEGPRGPSAAQTRKMKNANITVTPDEDTKVSDKAYNIVVGGTDKVSETSDESKEVSETNETVTVSLQSDCFVYDDKTDLYTISLSNCRLMRSDYLRGRLTFTVEAAVVNKGQSGKAEKHMDDTYINSVLDEILDTED